MLDAQLPRAREKAIHRGTIESSAPPFAIRLRHAREQLEIHLLREAAVRAVPGGRLRRRKHPRLQMIGDHAQHFTADVVPKQRMHVQTIQQRRRRPHAGLLMLQRSNPPVDECCRCRFAKIVADRAEHERDLLRIGQIVDLLARLVDDQERVNPHVAFRMPRGLLRAADQRVQFWKQPLDDSELECQREPDRRPPGAEQKLLDLSPDALRRQIVQRNGPAEGHRLRVDIVNGTVENLTTGKSVRGNPPPEFLLEMVAAGGLIPLLKAGSKFLNLAGDSR